MDLREISELTFILFFLELHFYATELIYNYFYSISAYVSSDDSLKDNNIKSVLAYEEWWGERIS